MAAATQDRDLQRQPAEIVTYNGASGYAYYKGTLVIRSGDGIITPLTAAGSSGGYFLGVMDNRVNLTAGLGSSNHRLQIWKTGEITLAANGTGASSHIGYNAFALDDQTVGTSMAAHSLCVGEITGFPTTSTYRVRIDNAVNTRGLSLIGVNNV